MDGPDVKPGLIVSCSPHQVEIKLRVKGQPGVQDYVGWAEWKNIKQ